ncbi:GNAT family N-acetyltransferase [Lacticaseibacillus paracasei]|uniref:GNAT family N-acetyltransferase n=1 Tax=Lacticaseibacillus paracasei TaxID=1597 RepID=UPI00386EBA66
MNTQKITIDAVPLLSSINSYADFRCSVEMIDDFLLRQAECSDKQYKTQTTTFWIHEKLVGYYTSHASVLTLKAPDVAKLKASGIELTDNVMSNDITVPTVSLAYFAVDKDYQQKGIGTALLHYFLTETAFLYLNDGLGFVGVTLSALPNAVEFYQKFGFEIFGNVDYDEGPVLREYSMFINVPVILDLESSRFALK